MTGPVHEHGGPDGAPGHGHDHAHGDADHGGHGHRRHTHIGHHHHAPTNFGRAFAIGIGLNAGFVVVEAGAGLYGHSVALLADAGHNVGDVLGLVVAWLASLAARRAPTPRFTYGFGASSMLAALFNALLLLVVVGALGLEAIQRIADPTPVAGTIVMVTAGVGILVNGVTAMLFARGRAGDLNIRGAYLHMISDALVSLGVLLAGGAILMTGWLWLDPLASLVVNLVVVVGTWGLLRDSFALCLHGVPPDIEPGAVDAFLRGQRGVAGVHDLHIWPMSTTTVALSAHLIMPDGRPGDAFLTGTAEALAARFGIGHTTLQVETTAHNACPQAHGHAAGDRVREPA